MQKSSAAQHVLACTPGAVALRCRRRLLLLLVVVLLLVFAETLDFCYETMQHKWDSQHQWDWDTACHNFL